MSLVHVDTFAVAADAEHLAVQIAQTEFVPASLRGKPAAVMAAMLTGHEVGIGPMMALKQIHVVEGRPAGGPVPPAGLDTVRPADAQERPGEERLLACVAAQGQRRVDEPDGHRQPVHLREDGREVAALCVAG